MLTEAEKKWLEEREKRHLKTGYYISLLDFPQKSLYWMTEVFNYYDAAKFEARVAAKLSIREDRLTPCILDPNPETHGECKQWRFYRRNSYAVYWGCAACRLKHARLAVEAEMEKENK